MKQKATPLLSFFTIVLALMFSAGISIPLNAQQVQKSNEQSLIDLLEYTAPSNATNFYRGNLNEGFEGDLFPPQGWRVINGGDPNTWIRYATTPITGAASAAISYGSTPHDDWLITPKLAPDADNHSFSFKAKQQSAVYIEKFNVMLSTTSNDVEDFTVTLDFEVGPAGTTPETYTYDLSDYIGQEVHIAIQAISTDEFRLYVDDFVGPPIVLGPPNMVVTGLNKTYSKIPAALLPASMNLAAAVINTGEPLTTATNMNFTIAEAGYSAVAAIEVPFATGDEQIISAPTPWNTSELSEGIYNLHYEADHAISNASDRVDNFPFEVTETLYSRDNGITAGGVGNSSPITFGMPFDIPEATVFSGMQVQWPNTTANSIEFQVAVYEINESFGVISTVLTSETFVKTAEMLGQTVDFLVEETPLAAGRYMLAVKQLGSVNIAMGYDQTPYGVIYLGNNAANPTTFSSNYDFGNLTMRMIINPSDEIVVYPKPRNFSAAADGLSAQLTWDAPILNRQMPAGFGTIYSVPSATLENQPIAELGDLPRDGEIIEVIPGTKSLATRNVLYDNGPFINGPGQGAGGADISHLHSGMTAYGANVNLGVNYSLADDFEVPAVWNVESFTFYTYQTGSPTTSSITGAFMQIWNGKPDEGGEIIYGDLVTNVMIDTEWTGVYRVSSTALTNTDRPIMSVTAGTPGLVLQPGTYWVEFSLTGSIASGPWGNPITITGETTTGNAMQNVTAGWQNWMDEGTDTQLGVPFLIDGTVGSGNVVNGPLLGYNIYHEGELLTNVGPEALDYLDGPLEGGIHQYQLTAVYGEPYAGESDPVNASVLIIAPAELPFVEDFDMGFENGWTFEPSQGNWSITTANGQPAPAAQFGWSPTATDYSFSMISKDIIAINADNVSLVFDLFLNDYAGNGNENMSVHVWNGSSWVLIETFSNNESIPWTTYTYNITAHAAGKVTKVKFEGHGLTTFDINQWYIDNISVTGEAGPGSDLPAPRNLSANINEQNVTLTWQAPDFGGGRGSAVANPVVIDEAYLKGTPYGTEPISVGSFEQADISVSQGMPEPVVTGIKHQAGYGTRDILWDNGPFVNAPGQGAGGADVSHLHSGQTTYGPNVNQGGNYLVADDFEVDAVWEVESFTFYAYQTGSGTNSTFTGGYIQILDAAPDAGGQVVWGDMTTNRMIATSWTNAYRTTETDLTNADRPIMQIVCATPGLSLDPGIYWVVYGLTGSAASGPWMAPVTITGQVNTGNGKQLTPDGWIDLIDDGANGTYGATFLIEGEAGGSGTGDYNLLGYNVYRDNELVGTTESYIRLYLDAEVEPGTHTYDVTAVYDEPTPGESDPISIEVFIEEPPVIFFEEPWTSGNFTENQWSFEPSQGNWSIATATGQPAPAAQFRWSPTQTDYSFTLVSTDIDATAAQADLTFEFGLNLNDYANNGNEHMIVSIWNGNTWVELDDIANNGTIPWTTYSYDVTAHALGKITKVKFEATGLTTYDFNYWYIDNIVLKGQGGSSNDLPAPRNLTANVNEQDVTLNWQAPLFRSGNAGNAVTPIEGGEIIAAGSSEPVDLNFEAGTPAPVITGIKHQSGTRSGSLLFDNGPFVNAPGQGAGGADVSHLHSGQNTFGPNMNQALDYFLADDFVVDETWTIESFTFYSYQTGSTTTSTYTGGYVQILDAAPDAGGQVVWGDLTTNLMASTSWTNAYRTNETDLTNNQRPIMDIVCATPGLTLEPGTYWVVFGVTGSAASGPWGVPVTITGQLDTGNAKQLTSTGWVDLEDSGTFTPYGMAFIIEGEAGGSGTGEYNLLGYNVYRNGTQIGETVADVRTYIDQNVAEGIHLYGVTAVYDEPTPGESDPVTLQVIVGSEMAIINVDPTELEESLGQNEISVQQITVTNTGNIPLEFDLEVNTDRAVLSYGIVDAPVASTDQPKLNADMLTNAGTSQQTASPNRGTLDQVIRYDNGINDDAIGLNGGGTFEVSAYWPASSMAQYAGMELEKVEMYINSVPSVATLKIYGAGSAAAPGSLIYSQSFSGAESTWVMVELDTPVAITGGDIWIGYEVTHADGQWPAGCDAGPAAAGFGDMIALGGAWDPISSLGFNVNWNIAAYLAEGSGQTGEWLSAAPLTGVVPAGESMTIDVTFDATGLAEGTYEGSLVFVSNDLTNPVVEVPVTLEVGDSNICYPAPRNLTDVVEGQDVTLSWQAPNLGGGGTGPVEDFYEDFESGTLPTGWVVYDVDGDGHIWDNTATLEGIYSAHSGLYCMASASYVNNLGALNPDNWLVTPAIKVTADSELKFWVAAQDPAYSNDQYYVRISTTGNAVANFTETIHSGITPQDWSEIVLDLGAYAGQTIYIAFVHADCTDWFYAKIDDVTVTNTESRAAYTAPVAANPIATLAYREGGSPAAPIANGSSELLDISTNTEAPAAVVSGVKHMRGTSARSLLFDNGPFVNAPGQGAGGADVSHLHSGQNTFGPNMNQALDYVLADDFVVDETWTIESFTFYAYQTGSTTTSTFTGGYLQVLDAAPDAGGQVVWGDLTTNLMSSTAWTNAYRTNETTLTNTDRPIMQIVCATSDLVLEPGTYWVVFGVTGSGASGPWGVPVTITGQLDTGNAKQLTGDGWVDLEDSGTFSPYGIAFLIEGETGGTGGPGCEHGELLGYNVYRNNVKIGETVANVRTYLDANVDPGTYTYGVSAVYGQPYPGESEIITRSVEVLPATSPVITVNPAELYQYFFEPGNTETQVLTIGNTGDGALEWSAAVQYTSKAIHDPVPEGSVTNEYIDLSVGEFEAGGSPALPETREDIILHYDGENEGNAIGLTGGGDFHVSARFPAAMVSGYSGFELKEVDVYVNDMPTSMTLYIRGAGTTTAPGTVLHQQTLNPTNGWNTFVLSTPVILDGNDLWVGYQVSHAADQFPAGCDGGPANPNGDWLSMDGNAWQHMADLGLDYNWNIRALISGSAWLTLGTSSGTVASGANQQINVHFNSAGLEIGEYTANILISSNDIATPVKTVPVKMDVGVGVEENDMANVQVYPVPANSILFIDLVDGVRQIRMMNIMGQIVKDETVNGELRKTLDLTGLRTGTYTLQFINDKGETHHKHIIISK